jgi:ABC-type branched-subunit amino acid transport system substrate-binding protein
MSRFTRRRLVSVTLALATVAALAFNPLSSGTGGSRALADDAKTIKLGVDLPLSGGEAASNIPTQNGVLLAVEEANAAGLPQGYKIAPYVLDDAVQGKHDPAQGAQNVRSFISDPSVLAFVGPANSSVAKAEIPLANDAGLVEIAASTTADGLTRGPDAAKLRIAHPVTALLTKVRATGADAIFFGGVSVTGGGLIRRQQVSLGLGKIPLLGGDGLAGGDYLETAGAAADGTYYTLSSPDVTKLPGAAKFIQAYRARFHADPGPYSANGYAAAKIIVAALVKAIDAGSGAPPTRAQVLHYVAETKDFTTPIGSVGFDKYGDTTAPILSLYEVKSSKAEFISQIDLKN